MACVHARRHYEIKKIVPDFIQPIFARKPITCQVLPRCKDTKMITKGPCPEGGGGLVEDLGTSLGDNLKDRGLYQITTW